jgi:iron(III) transport system ATP-binding protein
VSRVTIEGLVKHFHGNPPTKAVDDLGLQIEEGEFLILLGPSGCGKTTALRCLAGLETPSAGRIAFGDATVFDATRRVNLSPDKRNVGMVFQSYALWPHMTVRKNIAYPLRARKLKQGLKGGWVEETADLVDCGPLLDRYPAQLSGGQQQRVALARGLVARPELVLFDEPLSNLDARLRDQVRAEIHELHTRLGFTAVFVTHDQSEALALGDRLAVMRQGRIEQYDTPERVYEHPATEYVAAFLGMSNRLVCEYVDGAWVADGQMLGGAPVQSVPAATAIAVRLRREDVCLHPAEAEPPGGHTTAKATVVDSEYAGRSMDVVVLLGDKRLQARVSSGDYGSWARRLGPGDPVVMSFRPADAMVYPAEADRTADAEAVGEIAPDLSSVVRDEKVEV